MKNLHFRAITMLIGLYFTGTMANPSRKSSISFNSECQRKGYILTNCSFTGVHDTPVDRPQTAATGDTSAHFFRALLQSPMKKGDCNIKHLDLSNNLFSKITVSPLAHFHALEILNLSNSSLCSVWLDLPSPKSPRQKRCRRSLRRGLAFLQLLILRRNKLRDIPKGLWKLKSLQSLDLSFNGISQIGLSDFRNCLRLENLNLKSNKIFRIHPGAFKDLKKLQQVVDLSNNVLTTILPMMLIALEFPHLEVDLADNRWQCDHSVAAFQNFISESWRKTWNIICSQSVGNEEAYRWTPQRISRDTRLPLVTMNHMKSLIAGRAERPQEEPSEHFSTPGSKDPAGTHPSEKRSRLPRWVRSPVKEEASQDLTLAVCLAVFITFFVAFCLGAFARPFLDRLWQQRCGHKRPSSDNAYSNESFCMDIEAAGNTQGLRTDLPLREKQTPAGPDAAALPDGILSGSRQSRGPCRYHSGPGSGKDDVLLSDSEACSTLRGQTNADHKEPTPAGQDHIYQKDVSGEINYATVAQEDSLSEHSVGVPAAAGRLLTVSGSIHSDSDEFNAPLSQGMTASLSKMQACTKAQRTAENEKRGDTEWLPSEFSEEMQVSIYTNLLDTQQQRLTRASAEEGLPACSSEVTLSDPGEMNPSPPVLPPGWGRDLRVTPTNTEPEQKHAPCDPQCELDSNCDSDEGSLFTLSSSSDDERNVTEEEAHGEESHRASGPPEDKDSGVRKDNVTSLEDPEAYSTFQKILGKCENQEDRFKKPLIFGPDSGLYETHLESASNTRTVEDALTLPGSPGNSPLRDEIAGKVTYDYATALQSEAVEWQCSLRDLEFFSVDVLPQRPSCSPEAPSDSDKSDCHERDSDIYKYEPCIQGRNTAQNDTPLKVTTGENLRPSPQNPEGVNMNSHSIDTDANEGLIRPLEDYDSRKVISQTRLLQSCGDEPALQCEREERDYTENISRSQGPLLQEPPNETSSVGAQEPFGDRDWGTYSQENVSQSEKEHCNVSTQMQTQNNLLGVGSLCEDQLYYDRDQDI
ncbi:leucine-rich repeat-containing protein 66 isoform X1 [Panthera pardus]|uniref:Leucine-rich repeat-containing protein 66 isoform X1 n=1 Tax=Panthera pardus TaxID=9691 RepID=A0A9V1GN26_PANPR|nr:leucine-rich repeat-containing protein 66 isoform X1 [Panthera pardus]XP_019325714.2 leucine-rich repeat-containing protein 66 isoform X1 [Panthera pardus]